jgi:hypothetical protein
MSDNTDQYLDRVEKIMYELNKAEGKPAPLEKVATLEPDTPMTVMLKSFEVEHRFPEGSLSKMQPTMKPAAKDQQTAIADMLKDFEGSP